MEAFCRCLAQQGGNTNDVTVGTSQGSGGTVNLSLLLSTTTTSCQQAHTDLAATLQLHSHCSSLYHTISALPLLSCTCTFSPFCLHLFSPVPVPFPSLAMSTYKINRSVIVTASRTGRLDLHGLSLEAVPTDIFNQPLLLDTLTTLDLSQNKLKSLPAELSNFPKLRELLLDDNQLASLPVTLCDCTALRSICIDGNPLPRELLSLYGKARGVSGTSGRGRDVSAVLQWLVAHEEKELAREQHQVEEDEAALPPSISAAPSPVVSATPSPAGSRPGSAESASSSASRTKQQSLQSNVFSTDSSTAASPHFTGKRHNIASHQLSTVFSCASELPTGRTGRRTVSGYEGGSAVTAPFGTDSQPVYLKKEKRLPREESEKENEASSTVKSSPYAYLPPNPLEDVKKNNKQQQPSQSPFATVSSSHDYLKSSMDRPAANGTAVADRPALTPVVVSSSEPSKKPHVGESSDMSAALSGMSLAGMSAVPVKRVGGRARVAHGQKDSQLW